MPITSHSHHRQHQPSTSFFIPDYTTVVHRNFLNSSLSTLVHTKHQWCFKYKMTILKKQNTHSHISYKPVRNISIFQHPVALIYHLYKYSSISNATLLDVTSSSLLHVFAIHGHHHENVPLAKTATLYLYCTLLLLYMLLWFICFHAVGSDECVIF
jgi:hypothetical protein